MITISHSVELATAMVDQLSLAACYLDAQSILISVTFGQLLVWQLISSDSGPGDFYSIHTDSELDDKQETGRFDASVVLLNIAPSFQHLHIALKTC